DQAAQLPGELVWIDFGENFARGLGLSRGAGQAFDPVADFLDDRVSDCAWPAVELRRRGLEEAAAREDLPLHVGEMRITKGPEPARSRGYRQPGPQHLFGEDPASLLHGRQLELLLR